MANNNSTSRDRILSIETNQLHFGQSEYKSTPFTTESMKQKFNWNASTEKVEEALEGVYDDVLMKM